MKNLFFLSLAALSLTLFSFQAHKENVFELQENGNYKITNGNKISQEDIDFIIRMTTEYSGAAVFKTIKIFKTKVAKETVDTAVTKETQQDCDCPDKKPTDETIEELIQKYNN